MEYRNSKLRAKERLIAARRARKLGEQVPPSPILSRKDRPNNQGQKKTQKTGNSVHFGPIQANVQNLISHLQGKPPLGVLVAYVWDQASLMSRARRAPPAGVLEDLWGLTKECVVTGCLSENDILRYLNDWSVLQQRWPSWFAFDQSTMRILIDITLPCAIKRMSNEKLEKLIKVVREIAERIEEPQFTGRAHSSNMPLSHSLEVRVMMQRIFSLAVVEVLWRCLEERFPNEGNKFKLVTTTLIAGHVWAWETDALRDSKFWARVKSTTEEALQELKEMRFEYWIRLRQKKQQ